MSERLTPEELASSINKWCQEHRVTPANGQAGEAVSERNIRYYRTLGLLDGPGDDGYGEKHLLQLRALRLLQAHGLPLRRIRELLHGRSAGDLQEVIRRGLGDLPVAVAPAAARIAVPASDELWRAIPLGEDFLLISLRGTPLSPAQREAILSILQNEPNPITTTLS